MAHPAFFFNGHRLLLEVNALNVELGRRGPPHAGLDERIDDGAVAERAIALALWSFHSSEATPVARAPANLLKQVCGIKYLPPFGGRQRSLYLQSSAQRLKLNLLHRIAEREGAQLVNPLREC